MPYLLVLVAAVVSGLAVAGYTLRRGGVAASSPQAWTQVAVEPATEPPAAGGQEAEVGGSTAAGRRRATQTELPSAPTLQTRLTGIVGLLIAILVGAGIIAAGFYVLWETLSRAFGTT
jgi:hypothetical protein